MEIKHTIEILTKDIQDIENLVRNLNNYPTPPRIDIDLAMAKLRNVYELLAMISSDIKSDMEQAAPARKADPEPSIPEAMASNPEEMTKPATEMKDMREEVSDRGNIKEGKEISQEQELQKQRMIEQELKEQELQKQRMIEQELQRQKMREQELKEQELQRQKMREQTAADHLQGREEVSSDSSKHQDSITDATAEPDQSPVPGKLKEDIKKASIVAEKFAANKSINERIAPGNGRDVSSKLTGEPIDSIKRNIGINDRFLIIRELLNGDNEGYNQLVQQLDASANFDEAHRLIEQSFPNKMEHEGVDILVKLARRRFLNRNV
jgi:hypothetical protein